MADIVDYANGDFDVDLESRKVTHRPSGIAVSFYEYESEADWRDAESVTVRHNPNFDGYLRDVARCAKRAAIEAGMVARKPAKGGAP